jgi:small subunit ribosomal protein S16
MSVRLRLSRIGKHKVPFYRIVAIDSKKARDSKAIDIIGTYDALNSKLVTFNTELFEKWLKVGAQMSDSVKKIHRIFKKHGLNNIK